MPLITPETLTPITQFHSSALTSSTRVPCIATPALFTATCSLPKACSAARPAAATDAASDTSTVTPTALAPSASMS